MSHHEKTIRFLSINSDGTSNNTNIKMPFSNKKNNEYPTPIFLEYDKKYSPYIKCIDNGFKICIPYTSSNVNAPILYPFGINESINKNYNNIPKQSVNFKIISSKNIKYKATGLYDDLCIKFNLFTNYNNDNIDWSTLITECPLIFKCKLYYQLT